MAVTWPTPVLLNGHLVDEEDWEVHTDNLDDLNTRIGTGNGTALATRIGTLETAVNSGTTGNTALGTRVTALETLTGATGATAAGNAALSTRLGTGVTTSNTATSQLNAHTAQIAALENDQPAKHQLVLTLAADQSHATTSGGGNVAYHKILFPTPDVNVGFTVGASGGGSNPSGTNITIPTTGWYMASMSVRWQANAAGQRTAFLAATSNAEGLRYLWGSTDGWTLNATGWPKVQDGQPVYLTSGTQLSPWAYQNSGAAIPISSFAGATSLRLLFLGAS